MSSAPVVLVVGDANSDLVLRGDVVPRFGQAEQLLDSADLVLGGSASIMACGLARLGIPTALAAVVGDDLLGEFVRGELEGAGVDTRWLRVDPSCPSAMTVVLSAGDRSVLTFAGTFNSTSAEIVPDLDLLPSLRHLHLASYFLLPALRPDVAGLLKDASGRAMSTSLDTNWDPTEKWAGVIDLLPSVGTLFPNEPELTAITGEHDRDRAASRVTAHGCAVALKAGPEGGMLWTPGGERLSAAAWPVDVIDTTGAGDSFDAGFVSALLEGLSPQACLDRAVACGSLSTRAPGGTAAQPTKAELRSRESPND